MSLDEVRDFMDLVRANTNGGTHIAVGTSFDEVMDEAVVADEPQIMFGARLVGNNQPTGYAVAQLRVEIW